MDFRAPSGASTGPGAGALLRHRRSTLRLLEILGESGSILGLDISSEALKTLASRVGGQHRQKLRLVEGGLDNLGEALEKSSGFDLIFCAYGLYYSSNAVLTLNQARAWLKPGGRIAIVGPFGPNNKPLFDLVRQSGVSLPRPVVYSSERFMLETVLPWEWRISNRYRSTPWSTECVGRPERRC